MTGGIVIHKMKTIQEASHEDGEGGGGGRVNWRVESWLKSCTFQALQTGTYRNVAGRQNLSILLVPTLM
jgi:hypothetical protein